MITQGWRKFALIILLVVVSLAAFGFFTLCLWVYDKAEPERISSDKIKAAMKYHGVQSAECDWNDQCWFYRNGKKVEMLYD